MRGIIARQRFCRRGAAAPSSITSRSGAARGLVGGPRGAACVTRGGLQALAGILGLTVKQAGAEVRSLNHRPVSKFSFDGNR